LRFLYSLFFLLIVKMRGWMSMLARSSFEKGYGFV
jgi:hypothetical protein